MIRLFPASLTLALTLPASLLVAQEKGHNDLKSDYGTYGENGVPFFGQTLDARKLGDDWPTKNLTPRGIILQLGHGLHACFDPDLLRLSLVWEENTPGDYLAMNGMAPGSYRQPHRKAPGGQKKLPIPIGTPLFATENVPGIQLGDQPFQDPRKPSLDKEEVGLGALPEKVGRWKGLRLDDTGPVLLYQLHGVEIEERLRATETRFERILTVGPHKQPLKLPLQPTAPATIPPAEEESTWRLSYSRNKRTKVAIAPLAVGKAAHPGSTPPSRIWKETVKVEGGIWPPIDGFSFNKIPLPLPNPWKRNVRPSDFDFFSDGRLALLTFDGDVWIADEFAIGEASWRRFAAGLHEPMGLRIADNKIVVFDRNGLTRLHDHDNNGEADFYENFSNVAPQTAETREFAMSLELKPGGGFYLAKGGQVFASRGRLNGTIVEVSADGRTVKTIATGLRQPFIGVDPVSGRITASDQQGPWVPSTPLLDIKPGRYYGFQPGFLGPNANDGKTITEPPLWIPHFVNQSGARQVWLRNAKMGALNDSLIHFGYNKPGIFKIYLGDDDSQAAVVPLLTKFPASPTGFLGGRVNPKDGLLYLAGLNLWGTVGKEIQGLYRLEPAKEPSRFPTTVRAYQEGVILRFAHPLEHDHAVNRAHYAVDRWNYKRTSKYGSGHFKLDGSPGQDPLAVSCIYISEDHQSVFLGIPGMKPVHSLRVSFQVQPKLAQSAYLTIKHLEPVNLTEHGFEEVSVDLTPKSIQGGPQRAQLSPKLGREIASTYGCLACHSVDGSKQIAEEPSLVVGPSWKGLFGSTRSFTKGNSQTADEAYLRESILEPGKRVTKGFETTKTGVGMPSYLGVLNDDQIDAVILYIKSLK